MTKGLTLMTKVIKIQIIKTVISAIAMVAVMVIIFTFSGQNSAKSSNVSDSISDVVVDILDKEVPPGQSSSSVPIVFGFTTRKLAHIFLYMMLGLTGFLFAASAFGFKKPPFKLTPLYISLTACVICFLYACSDELHQYFVSGRAATFSDVGIDTIGYIITIALSCAVYLIIKLIISKRQSKQSAV